MRGPSFELPPILEDKDNDTFSSAYFSCYSSRYLFPRETSYYFDAMEPSELSTEVRKSLRFGMSLKIHDDDLRRYTPAFAMTRQPRIPG